MRKLRRDTETGGPFVARSNRLMLQQPNTHPDLYLWDDGDVYPTAPTGNGLDVERKTGAQLQAEEPKPAGVLWAILCTKSREGRSGGQW